MIDRLFFSIILYQSYELTLHDIAGYFRDQHHTIISLFVTFVHFVAIDICNIYNSDWYYLFRQCPSCVSNP